MDSRRATIAQLAASPTSCQQLIPIYGFDILHVFKTKLGNLCSDVFTSVWSSGQINDQRNVLTLVTPSFMGGRVSRGDFVGSSIEDAILVQVLQTVSETWGGLKMHAKTEAVFMSELCFVFFPRVVF